MRVLIALLLALGMAASHVAVAVEPLVIVVHGIGGGNREDGWSRDVARAWNVETHEVTFREPGRTGATSFTDFARKAGDWAMEVQRQIRDIARNNPGRRIMIVSHSWGTVATKMALAGGVASGLVVQAIPPGELDIEEWVTLGSPLGRADDPRVAGNLRQLNVEIPSGRPANVRHWTNFYDVDDPVSRQSRRLDGAANLEIEGSGSWWDISGMTAHTGIWTHRRVGAHVWDQALRIANMPPPLPPRDAGRPDRAPGSGAGESNVLVEYRALLPRYLEATKQPWHTHIDVIANATPMGSDRYRVNWKTYCLIERGPDVGKDYLCFERDDALNMGQISQAVREFKKALGIR